MISFKLFLVIYLTGGITFLPVVLCTYWFLKQKYDELNEKYEEQREADRLLFSGIDPDFKAGEFEELHGVNVIREGWISVTRKYYHHHTELNNEDSEDVSEIPQRSQLKKKHRFYAILRHGNLFLYRDSLPRSNLVHAIPLQDSFVTLWPRNPVAELPDSSLFTKKTCISILRKGVTSINQDKLQFRADEEIKDDSQATNQFFLYIDNNIDKEDWYFSLINVAKNDLSKDERTFGLIDPNITARTAHLKTTDALYLIQTINSTENQLTTKWINAVIGRLFLAVQRTDALKDYLYTRLYEKLAKIDKPDFFGDLIVEEVDVGNSAPLITNPKLLDLAPDGLLRVSVDFKYIGDLSVIVSTKATINLGSHFRQREVPMQLSIKLKELSGPLIVLLKPPPSNRFWYTFESEPVLSLEIEPVVSSSKLSYTMITNAIKSKFAEAIKDSLVLPNWDDMVFFNTDSEIYRGGIWEKYDKNVEHPIQDHKEAILKEMSSLSKKNEILDQPSGGQTKKKDEQEDELVNGSDEESQSKSQDPTLKRRTLQKVGNLKRVLQHKSGDNLPDEHSSNEGPTDSPVAQTDGAESDGSADSNKIFKNSIKKLGKWYKEAVSPNTEDASPQEHSSANSSNPQSPEMISNRRKSLPRRPPPSGIPSAAAYESYPTSPTSNTAEMFANQKKSISSNESSEKNFSSTLPPNYHQVHNRAFMKVRSNEFDDVSYDEELRERQLQKSNGHGTSHMK